MIFCKNTFLITQISNLFRKTMKIDSKLKISKVYLEFEQHKSGFFSRKNEILITISLV